jgi:L-rhamnose-H+ transport protein
MLNFSFVFGKPLQDAAAAAGAGPDVASFAIWAPALAGGFVANGGYALYLLMKNRTWGVFTATGVPGWFWLGATLMGLMWYGGVSLYGLGGSMMGPLGAVVGWPVFMSTVVIVGNILGVIAGEWRGAGSQAKRMSWIGVAILVAAIVVISRAS